MAKQVKVPAKAPSQTVVSTGEGSLAKGQVSAPAALPAEPASHGSTGPTIAAPSVDYNTQQGDRRPAPVEHLGVSASDYATEQAQGRE